MLSDLMSLDDLVALGLAMRLAALAVLLVCLVLVVRDGDLRKIGAMLRRFFACLNRRS